jgi:hypothetical protein
MFVASEIKPTTTKKSILPFDFTAQEKMTSTTSEMAKISFGFSTERLKNLSFLVLNQL